MKTILIVSDVLITEQINGVGTWLINTHKELEKIGFRVVILNASHFSYTFPLPSYKEIRLVIALPTTVKRYIEELQPDYIHIATEGTLGLLARLVCTQEKWHFTTSYHTRFPEYIFVRTNMRSLERLVYRYMRWFHATSDAVIVTTDKLKEELESKQFTRIAVVPLGVDTRIFRRNHTAYHPPHLQKPVFAYLGRIAPEKNVEAFLTSDFGTGSKLVIGDGPLREGLEKTYGAETTFIGYKKGQELVDALSIADVCVFTSKTDTFGLTIIEALACGVPVAAHDVQGPNTIITHGKDGHLGDDLVAGALYCLSIDREVCRQTAELYSWEASTEKLVTVLVPRRYVL